MNENRFLVGEYLGDSGESVYKLFPAVEGVDDTPIRSGIVELSGAEVYDLFMSSDDEFQQQLERRFDKSKPEHIIHAN